MIRALNLEADYYLQKSEDPEVLFTELTHFITRAAKRKRNEEKLRENEEKFSVLAEQNLFGMAIVQNGLVKYFNSALVDIFGYSAEEITNWPPYGFVRAIHSENRRFVMDQLQKKQSGEKNVVNNYSQQLVTKTGEVKWVTCTLKQSRMVGKLLISLP